MLKTYEIIWPHNLAKSMQTFVGWGKGEKLDPPPPLIPPQTSVKFHDFAKHHLPVCFAGP